MGYVILKTLVLARGRGNKSKARAPTPNNAPTKLAAAAPRHLPPHLTLLPFLVCAFTCRTGPRLAWPGRAQLCGDGACRKPFPRTMCGAAAAGVDTRISQVKQTALAELFHAHAREFLEIGISRGQKAKFWRSALVHSLASMVKDFARRAARFFACSQLAGTKHCARRFHARYTRIVTHGSHMWRRR